MAKIYGNRMFYKGWKLEDVPERYRDGAKAEYERLKAEAQA